MASLSFPYSPLDGPSIFFPHLRELGLFLLGGSPFGPSEGFRPDAV